MMDVSCAFSQWFQAVTLCLLNKYHLRGRKNPKMAFLANDEANGNISKLGYQTPSERKSVASRLRRRTVVAEQFLTQTIHFAHFNF